MMFVMRITFSLSNLGLDRVKIHLPTNDFGDSKPITKESGRTSNQPGPSKKTLAPCISVYKVWSCYSPLLAAAVSLGFKGASLFLISSILELIYIFLLSIYLCT